AAATHTPQVILFGPTNPFHWRPRQSPALILQGRLDTPVTEFVPVRPRFPMSEISTEAVINAMDSLLSRRATAHHSCGAQNGLGKSSPSGKRYVKLPARTGGFTVTSSPTNCGSFWDWRWVLLTAEGIYFFRGRLPAAPARFFKVRAPRPRGKARTFTRFVNGPKCNSMILVVVALPPHL